MSIYKNITENQVSEFANTLPSLKCNDYSTGFQRWQKLTKKELQKLYFLFDCNVPAIKNALQTQTAKELIGTIH
jgi:hypothetical protein